MRLLLLEQIELVQEQAVVERVGSAGGLVEEPILPGPHSNHRRGWPRVTAPPLIKAEAFQAGTFFEGFLSKKFSENEKTNILVYGQVRGDEWFPSTQDSKTNVRIWEGKGMAQNCR
jgi:hypothetical protein